MGVSKQQSDAAVQRTERGGGAGTDPRHFALSFELCLEP
jgi:hypothetical protein